MAKTTRAICYITEGDFQRSHTEKIRNRHRRNPAVQLLASARNRAKVFGFPFNLTLADIVVPTHCPALGIPINFEAKNNVPSLDRVIPSKGYVAGNVNVISWRANRLKLNASLKELEGLVEYVKSALDKHPVV
jgi:hypothetical protein